MKSFISTVKSYIPTAVVAAIVVVVVVAGALLIHSTGQSSMMAAVPFGFSSMPAADAWASLDSGVVLVALATCMLRPRH
ncbi:MAG: hypothetical protein WCP30_00875 [Mycobacteriaceae bacterium]